MHRYRSSDATFILNELPLRSTSAHGILISGYAHAGRGETPTDVSRRWELLLKNPVILLHKRARNSVDI